MATFQLKRQQFIKGYKKEVWNFISRSENLERITPPSMKFRITGEPPQAMYKGMMITYKVSPLPLYTTTWVTEITHIDEGNYFVDEQRIGPYRMWHHEHHLETKDDGVVMTDIITYTPPFGWLGRLANFLVIKPQLKRIFDHRKKVINQLFNE